MLHLRVEESRPNETDPRIIRADPTAPNGDKKTLVTFHPPF